LQDARTVVQGDFWTVGGSIVSNAVTFAPIYQLNTAGDNAPSTGTHRIEVRNGSTVLFTRFFTPTVAESESGGDDVETAPFFYELIPIQAGATSIRVFNAAVSGTQIGQINFGGAVPTVTITAPLGGSLSGQQTVSWNISDPNGGSHTYWIQYSPSNAAFGSWQTLAAGWTQTSITINFDEIAGADGTGRIRVLASDGVNTGIGTSNAFTVPSHLPAAEITDPLVATFAKVGDLVWLQGYGFDYDEGFLSGAALSWSSNLQGNLGTGDSLPLTSLTAGVHTITFTARDANNNASTDTIQVTIDGLAPDLTMYVTADGTPSSCVAVFIDAIDPAFSSGMENVRYSLNGGTTWTNLAANSLPFRLIVPGTGYFNLIVEALDKASNLDVASQEFFIQNLCPANLLNNETFNSPVGSDPADQWAVYSVPGGTLPNRIQNGVFEFYREPSNTQGVIFQQTLTGLSGSIPLDVMVDLGNTSAVNKRITLILWDEDFDDLRVCSFWLAPNTPLRTYRMLTSNLVDWTNATLHIYASSADGQGWYQIDNVSLRYNLFVTRPQTLCLDPNAPLPVVGAPNGAELINDGAFNTNQPPPFNAENQWGHFWTPQNEPVANHFAFQRNPLGYIEMYRKPPASGSNSGVILQYTQDTVPANTVIEARFSLGNSNAQRARVTVLLHPRNFDRDLAVCSFWIEPGTNTAQPYVMRAYTHRAWDTVGVNDATISFYASSAHSSGWTILDAVSLRTRPALGTVGVECYPSGSDVPGGAAGSADMGALMPTLEPTATWQPYLAPGQPAEQPLIATPAPASETTTGEGTNSE
ncbi:MAG: hypothetical protein SGI73_15865, partial [Chloroflexota bacterium]|nr:hypothetical protein [Chloroflexota bacterium]